MFLIPSTDIGIQCAHLFAIPLSFSYLLVLSNCLNKEECARSSSI
uniref:Uncharacterized protein n=1 Tax=Arundo donax TaxID=35708 RepID=A0A0A9AJU7_ARUDO